MCSNGSSCCRRSLVLFVYWSYSSCEVKKEERDDWTVGNFFVFLRASRSTRVKHPLCHSLDSEMDSLFLMSHWEGNECSEKTSVKIWRRIGVRMNWCWLSNQWQTGLPSVKYRGDLLFLVQLWIEMWKTMSWWSIRSSCEGLFVSLREEMLKTFVDERVVCCGQERCLSVRKTNVRLVTLIVEPTWPGSVEKVPSIGEEVRVVKLERGRWLICLSVRCTLLSGPRQNRSPTVAMSVPPSTVTSLKVSGTLNVSPTWISRS